MDIPYTLPDGRDVTLDVYAEPDEAPRLTGHPDRRHDGGPGCCMLNRVMIGGAWVGWPGPDGTPADNSDELWDLVRAEWDAQAEMDAEAKAEAQRDG